jgi:hypothetical protein
MYLSALIIPPSRVAEGWVSVCELRKFPDLQAVFCLLDVNRSYVLPEDKDSCYAAEVSAQKIRNRGSCVMCHSVAYTSGFQKLQNVWSIHFVIFFFMFVVLYILVTYMFNSSPTRCTMYTRFFLYFLTTLALHVSGANCMVIFRMTDRAKVLRCPKTRTCSDGIIHQTIQNLWLYTVVVLLMMGANSTRNM